MQTENYLLTFAVGFIGTFGGLAIGYYKSKSELANLIDIKIKQACSLCGLKKEVDTMGSEIKEVAKDLKHGSEMFSSIKSDIAVIKVKLGIKSEMEELKNALAALEKKHSKA